MKRTVLFIFLLALLSAFSGLLLSKVSFAGRTGISLFYTEYKFLKTWWQGALAVFMILLIILGGQGFADKKLSRPKAKLVHITMVLFALAGLYVTYYDFSHTTTHRFLGGRFHLGAYLFWVDCILISLFYLAQKKPQPPEP